MAQSEKRNSQFQKVERLLHKGRYHEALELVRGFDKQQLDNIEELQSDILESRCLIKLGEYETALQKSAQVTSTDAPSVDPTKAPGAAARLFGRGKQASICRRR